MDPISQVTFQGTLTRTALACRTPPDGTSADGTQGCTNLQVQVYNLGFQSVALTLSLDRNADQLHYHTVCQSKYWTARYTGHHTHPSDRVTDRLYHHTDRKADTRTSTTPSHQTDFIIVATGRLIPRPTCRPLAKPTTRPNLILPEGFTQITPPSLLCLIT